MYYTINEQSFQGETRQVISFRCKDKINAETTLELLARESHLSEGDICRLLYALEHLLTEQLQLGNRVEIGRIGTFYPSLKTNRLKPGKRFDRRLIKKATIGFRPAKKLTIDPTCMHLQQIPNPP